MALLLTLYRGQKHWTKGEVILAPTLRRSYGSQPLSDVTESKLLEISEALAEAEANKSGAGGESSAAKDLEYILLSIQDTRTLSPYVSCSSAKNIAISFALSGDSPGYVVEVQTEAGSGFLDFNAVRQKYNLWSDAKSYLCEIGVPRRVEPCWITRVSRFTYTEQQLAREEVIFNGDAAA